MATTRVTFDFLALVLDLPDGITIEDLEVTEMDDENKVLTLHLEGGELEDGEHALNYKVHRVNGAEAYAPVLASIEPINSESS